MMSFDQAVNGVWEDTMIPLHFYFIKAMPVTGSRHLSKHSNMPPALSALMSPAHVQLDACDGHPPD
jgi:hypothetical protein